MAAATPSSTVQAAGRATAAGRGARGFAPHRARSRRGSENRPGSTKRRKTGHVTLRTAAARCGSRAASGTQRRSKGTTPPNNIAKIGPPTPASLGGFLPTVMTNQACTGTGIASKPCNNTCSAGSSSCRSWSIPAELDAAQAAINAAWLSAHGSRVGVPNTAHPAAAACGHYTLRAAGRLTSRHTKAHRWGAVSDSTGCGHSRSTRLATRMS